ncbi:hypothetical protein N825_28965 [Skermanella stibiiresistens SB22]|uniref:Uncharacterized protein n=1 Tax=Skermanella stibiiresistens SB22 TaxID=1385369 RepID=W9GUG9_9PROT|nr:hypothetical protein [Skermanella stibiiresistens]EWY36306.1 hypothetical protein N825_28965 [Skermanella stibiiresistens SB22]
MGEVLDTPPDTLVGVLAKLEFFWLIRDYMGDDGDEFLDIIQEDPRALAWAEGSRAAIVHRHGGA